MPTPSRGVTLMDIHQAGRDELITYAVSLFRWHLKNGLTTWQQVDRLIGVNAEMFCFEPVSIRDAKSAHVEAISPDQCRQLASPYTYRASPRRLTPPIVVIETQGHRFLIDGRNRCNHAAEAGLTLEAIVITI
jgi:hypothetical protein